MMDLTQLMHAAEEILREDGERILAMKGPEVFTKEGHANFVTSADLESQRFLVERLTPLLPGANFFAEEKEDNALAPGFNWLIDPIDGTTNFMRGYRHSAISVGLVQDGRGVMGLVYNPYSGELFSALRGAGAWCSGVPIHAAQVPPAGQTASLKPAFPPGTTRRPRWWWRKRGALSLPCRLSPWISRARPR